MGNGGECGVEGEEDRNGERSGKDGGGDGGCGCKDCRCRWVLEIDIEGEKGKKIGMVRGVVGMMVMMMAIVAARSVDLGG